MQQSDGKDPAQIVVVTCEGCARLRTHTHTHTHMHAPLTHTHTHTHSERKGNHTMLSTGGAGNAEAGRPDGLCL